MPFLSFLPEPSVTEKRSQASGHTVLPERLYRPAAGESLLCANLTPQANPLHSQLAPHIGPAVTYIHIRSQLDKKALPLEAQLPHLGPVEGIDLRETLGEESTP